MIRSNLEMPHFDRRKTVDEEQESEKDMKQSPNIATDVF